MPGNTDLSMAIEQLGALTDAAAGPVGFCSLPHCSSILPNGSDFTLYNPTTP